MKFDASRKKIERAYEHIKELNSAVSAFGNSDFYTLRLEHNPRTRINYLHITIDPTDFLISAALISGDILHNLRSALDILYYEIVTPELASKYTRFPVRNSLEELKVPLKAAFEKGQISDDVMGLIRDKVKPYQTGNPAIWALDDLNIIDKHQLLIPSLQFMVFDGIRLEDEQGSIISVNPIFADETCKVRLTQADNRIVKLKDKGHAAATVLFEAGLAVVQGQPIIPALSRIAEEVERTVKAFGSLLGLED
jgi:hypothetical protein